MESKSQHNNEGIETIQQDLDAAETIIRELDAFFYASADQNDLVHNYLPIACQLSELSKSYQEIQNLLNNNKNPDMQKTIN